jgi:hypothetical protein
VKRNLMLMFLFLSALMLSSVGNVSNASALGNYYCNAIPLSDTHFDCLRHLLDTNTNLNAPKGSRGVGNYNCATTNNDRTPARRDCLRAKLDRYAPGLAARMAPSNDNTYSLMPDGNSGSNYNHLRDPMATGGVNGVEDSSHSCTQFSGAPRTACEAAAMNRAHGSNVQNNHCATFFGPARASCEARNP